MRHVVNSLAAIAMTLFLWLTVSLGGQVAIAAAMPLPTSPDAQTQALVRQELQTLPRGFYGILQTDQLKAKLDNEAVTLIDVRQPSEFRSGHIEGAINIPLRKLGERLTAIPQNSPVVLYCSTGYRTGLGVMALHLLGYENVRGYPPSYEGWKQDNA